METKTEIAIRNFKNGYNCAQAVVCTYCEDFGIEEETAFRLAEGFGSGIPGLKTICGAASGMVMIASLKKCPTKDMENTTKKITYPCVMDLVNKFKEDMSDIECEKLLKIKDNTLIDGKKAGCISCVQTACRLIEENLYENE